MRIKNWSEILTREFLNEECFVKNKQLSLIAREIGCAETTIRRHADKFGIRTEGNDLRLEGKRFGRLVVTSKGVNTNDSNSVWNCLCDCGKSKKVYGRNLTCGKTQSCGCLHKAKVFKGMGDLSGQYWSNIKVQAAKRRLKFEISIDYAWELFLNQNKKCALSGLDIILDPNKMQNSRNKINIQTASLDRIDSSKGYIEGNVQWLHKDVNIMKNSLQEDRFIYLCKAIYINNENNKTGLTTL